MPFVSLVCYEVARKNQMRFRDLGLVVCEACTLPTPTPHVLTSLSLSFTPLPLLHDTPLEFRSVQSAKQLPAPIKSRGKKKSNPS